mmetsp:Transcript_71540/g.141863  ORF Transcript_71540/g.141863 Transcript_71540/m.141863 type:complete len:516 (+) Transcript_71540:54-1601(+)
MEGTGLSGSSQEGQALAMELLVVQKALESQSHTAADLAAQLATLSSRAAMLSARTTNRLDSVEPLPATEQKPQVPNILDKAEDSQDVGPVHVHQVGLFSSTDELNKQIRENLSETPYSVTSFYKDAGIFQAIARDKRFEAASLLLVIASSFWMAFDIDYNDALFLHEAHVGYQLVAHAICFLFTAELVIRFSAFKIVRNVVKDFWCMFDLLLVFFLVLETWIFWLMIAAFGLEFSANNIRVFSVLRMLRLVRVLRLVKLFRFLPEVLVIVKGIAVALRPISLVFTLLFMIIYISAIIFRVMLENTKFGAEQFRTVPHAIATLLLDCAMSGTRGGPLMKEAYQQHAIYSFLIFIFVLLTNVTMMGLLVGLLVQTIKKVAEVEEEEKKNIRNKETMVDFWNHVKEMDADNDGFITVDEFFNLLRQRKTVRLLKKMDVEPEGLILLSDFVFEDGHGRLSQVDFNQWVLDMRLTQRGTIKDHIATRKFMTSKFRQFFKEAANGEPIHGAINSRANSPCL